MPRKFEILVLSDNSLKTDYVWMAEVMDLLDNSGVKYTYNYRSIETNLVKVRFLNPFDGVQKILGRRFRMVFDVTEHNMFINENTIIFPDGETYPLRDHMGNISEVHRNPETGELAKVVLEKHQEILKDIARTYA